MCYPGHCSNSVFSFSCLSNDFGATRAPQPPSWDLLQFAPDGIVAVLHWDDLQASWQTVTSGQEHALKVWSNFLCFSWSHGCTVSLSWGCPPFVSTAWQCLEKVRPDDSMRKLKPIFRVDRRRFKNVSKTFSIIHDLWHLRIRIRRNRESFTLSKLRGRFPALTFSQTSPAQHTGGDSSTI